MDMLMVTADQRKKVREYFNVSEDQIKEDVERIKTWKEKQAHLPYDITDDFIEKVLLRNKFRVERTKQKLDNYYSLRGHFKDLYQNMEHIIASQEIPMCLPMLKLTPNLERVVIIKILDADPDPYNFLDFIKLSFLVEELCLQYDYSIGTRFIWDLENISFKHTLKWNPLVLTKYVSLIEKSYSCRILGAEFINCSPLLSKIMAILRPVVRAKIYERITVHEDITSLHKVIPKECLPKEYGGTLESIPHLLKNWDAVIKNHKEFFVKNYENVKLSTSMEELRQVDLNVDDNAGFGVDGTFKKLQID